MNVTLTFCPPLIIWNILFFKRVTLGIFLKRAKHVNSTKANRLDYISWLYPGSHISKQARLYFEILVHTLQPCCLSCSPGTDTVSSTSQNRLPSVFLHILMGDRDSQAPVKSAQLWPQDPSRSSFPPVFTHQSAMMKLSNLSEKHHNMHHIHSRPMWWEDLIICVRFRGNL